MTRPDRSGADDAPRLHPPRRRDALRAPAEPGHRGAAASRRPCATAFTAGARAGSGETFWQFRPFISGRAVVAGRLAPLGARGARLRARARMGGGAHGLDLVRPLGVDAVRLEPRAGLEDRPRAVLALAFADLCVRGGERAGLLGLTRPLATQGVIERFAEAIATDERLQGPRRPPCRPRSPAAPRSMVLLIGDFLVERRRTSRAHSTPSAQRARSASW